MASLFSLNRVYMHQLKPKIISIKPKKLIGISKEMSLNEDKTFELWKSFMPIRNKVENRVSSDLISLQVYDSTPSVVNMEAIFTKWAVVEVDSFDALPNDMKTLEIDGGLYAIFHYKGLNTDKKIFIDIYLDWLPESIYALDNRPHFQVLGPKYKNNDPNSEEDIYIPIKIRRD